MTMRRERVADRMRYSAFASDNADNISTKFRFTPVRILQRPRILRNLPHHRDPLARREVAVVVFRLFAELELPHGPVGAVGHTESYLGQSRLKNMATCASAPSLPILRFGCL